MQAGAKAAAAIAVLTDMFDAKRPAKVALKAWGRSARYAGARDRAYVSGLVLDALRHKSALVAAMGADTPRALVLGTLGRIWGQSADEMNEEFTQNEHGPAPLDANERAGLSMDLSAAADPVRANVPDWLWPHFVRAFADLAGDEGVALAARAPVDLRLNTLKRSAADTLKAVAKIGGEAISWLPSAARIPAPDANTRSAHVHSLPGFAKGWIEVQDAGSQFVALCTGIGPGQQVLDYCAGGGGKTLAMAQQMQNKGQIFAYDRDGRRLVPIHARLKRAGVRNAQVRDPRDDEPLADLIGKMDAVLLDAPCTGTGTWRRHPDAKWRLKQTQLDTRMREQDQVLAAGAPFVRPGGMMFYVTCSLLLDENEDRIDTFLENQSKFERMNISDIQQIHLDTAGVDMLAKQITKQGDLRLSPRAAGTDGFYMAALRRKK